MFGIIKVKKLKDKGSTGIFVTNDIPAACHIADRIAIFHNKRIHVIDTVEKIKQSQDPIIKSFLSGNREI